MDKRRDVSNTRSNIKKDKDLWKVNHTEAAVKTGKWAGDRSSILWLVLLYYQRQSCVNLLCIQPEDPILQQKVMPENKTKAGGVQNRSGPTGEEHLKRIIQY